MVYNHKMSHFLEKVPCKWATLRYKNGVRVKGEYYLFHSFQNPKICVLAMPKRRSRISRPIVNRQLRTASLPSVWSVPPYPSVMSWAKRIRLSWGKRTTPKKKNDAWKRVSLIWRRKRYFVTIFLFWKIYHFVFNWVDNSGLIESICLNRIASQLKFIRKTYNESELTLFL